MENSEAQHPKPIQAPNYDDIGLFERFSQEKTQEAEDNAKDWEDKDPIFYLLNNNNNYKLRVYPFVVIDPDTQQQKLQLTRITWSHSGFDKMRRIPCAGRDCPICTEVKRLADAKHEKAWRYKSKKEAVAVAYFYESNAPKDYKYLKLNEYGYVVLRNKAYNSLSSFLSTLTPDDMRSVLNPKVEAPRLTLSLTPGSDGNASWGFDLRKATLPPLPEGFKDIHDVYVQESEVVTDAELKDIRKQINGMLANLSGMLVEPEGPSVAAPRAGAGEAGAAVKDALGAAAGAPAPAGGLPECPGKPEGLEYGKAPSVLTGDQNVTCLCCPHEGACATATKAALPQQGTAAEK